MVLLCQILELLLYRLSFRSLGLDFRHYTSSNFFKMKTFLILLFSMMCVFARAQHAYIPMPLDTAVWVTVRTDWNEDIPGAPPSYDYWIYYFYGQDTLIQNGKRYHTLFNSSHYYMPILYNQVIGQHGFPRFREDTIIKKSGL